jgi:hypothetical protein
MAASIQGKVMPLGLVAALFETVSIDPKTRQVVVCLVSSPRWTRFL